MHFRYRRPHHLAARPRHRLQSNRCILRLRAGCTQRTKHKVTVGAACTCVSKGNSCKDCGCKKVPEMRPWPTIHSPSSGRVPFEQALVDPTRRTLLKVVGDPSEAPNKPVRNYVCNKHDAILRGGKAIRTIALLMNSGSGL